VTPSAAGDEPPRRFVVLTGKIAPRDRGGFEIADADGTVNPAQGSAKEARKLDERDQASPSGGEHELASEVSERIRGIISSAEAAANAVRHEAEQRAQTRQRIAEEEAERIVADARSNAEALLAERIRRISELSDGIVERGESIVAQLDRAEEVRAQLQRLADSLGETAEGLAHELGGEQPVARGAAAAAEAPAKPHGDPIAEATAAPVAEPEVDTAEPEPAAEPAQAETVEPEPEAEEEPEAEVPPLREADEPAVEASAAIEVVDIVEQRREALRSDEPEAAEDRREPDEQLSARLVALQMAVAGGNRGEVAEHLRRTFDVGDLAGILDDVFGSGTDADKRVVWPRTAS
jgi:hypothetical protein